MPYVSPSPSTSPCTTFAVPSPIAESSRRASSGESTATVFDFGSRPLRHHSRSHSSDSLMPNSFIFVQPASPDDKPPTPSSGASSNGSSSPSSFPSLRSRRIKLFGFTPTDQNDDGPSSQDESNVIPLNEPDPMTSVKLVASSSRGAMRRPLPHKANSDFPVSTAMAARTTSADNPPAALSKTPMLRHKSGELVRPSLKHGERSSSTTGAARARSAPSTPISPKYVHFDTQLEHVKHFLAQQRPAAVSRSGSPVETETEDEPDAYPFPAMSATDANDLVLKMPNFPALSDTAARDVTLEKLDLTTDNKSLSGIVRVKNLSFEKWVAVRFTFDNWQTVSEVSAVHKESIGSQADRFSFTIKLHDLLPRLPEKTMHLAIRYTVSGREIWDNNDGQNYRIQFSRRPAAMTVPASTSSASGFDSSSTTKRQTWSVTTARQADDRMADLRKGLDRLLAEDLDPENMAPKLKNSDTSSFSNRYTFGNSFKMYGGRSSFEEANVRVKASAPPQYTSTLVNGHPATIFAGPDHSRQQQQPQQQQARPASPVLPRREEMMPDFGTYRPRSEPPSTSTSTKPDFPSTWLKLNDFPPKPTLHERHSTHPGTGSTGSHSPLHPGRFLNHRPTVHSPAHSPAASPAPSPSNGSPVNGSPMASPSISPAVSPGRSRSPELFSAPALADDHPWSPASSVDTIMTASYSPDSETTPSSSDTSVPDSPLHDLPTRPKDANEFSSFLDRYCFHTSHVPSSLGLTNFEPYGDPRPIPLPSSSSNGATPRNGSSTASTPVAPCALYYSSSSASNSGSSTPNYEDVSSTTPTSAAAPPFRQPIAS